MHVPISADLSALAVPFKPLAALGNAWRALMSERKPPYRPEKHYMRGPGPKCRERQARALSQAAR